MANMFEGRIAQLQGLSSDMNQELVDLSTDPTTNSERIAILTHRKESIQIEIDRLNQLAIDLENGTPI
jgi:flagellar biosynthesis/type III secretory pathway chaperone